MGHSFHNVLEPQFPHLWNRSNNKQNLKGWYEGERFYVSKSLSIQCPAHSEASYCRWLLKVQFIQTKARKLFTAVILQVWSPDQHVRMEIRGPHPSPTELETGELGPSNLFQKTSKILMNADVWKLYLDLSNILFVLKNSCKESQFNFFLWVSLISYIRKKEENPPNHWT